MLQFDHSPPRRISFGRTSSVVVKSIVCLSICHSIILITQFLVSPSRYSKPIRSLLSLFFPSYFSSFLFSGPDVSLSRCYSIFLCIAVFVCFCLTVVLPLFLSISVSLPLPLSVSIRFLLLSLPLNVCLSFCLSVCSSLSLSLSLCLLFYSMKGMGID